jgi:NhaA family Na+:H+ antiporter
MAHKKSTSDHLPGLPEKPVDRSIAPVARFLHVETAGGIVLLSYLAVAAGLARLPQGVTWGMIAAGGCLAGIGLTMAMFTAGLALEGELLDTAKIGILAASVISAALGMSLPGMRPKPVPEAVHASPPSKTPL